MRIPVVGISGNVRIRISLRSSAFPGGSKRGKCFAFFCFTFFCFALFGIACIFGENVCILRAIFPFLRTSPVLVRLVLFRLYQQIGQGGEVPFPSFGGFQPYFLYLGRGQYPLLLIGFGVEKGFLHQDVHYSLHLLLVDVPSRLVCEQSALLRVPFQVISVFLVYLAQQFHYRRRSFQSESGFHQFHCYLFE